MVVTSRDGHIALPVGVSMVAAFVAETLADVHKAIGTVATDTATKVTIEP